MNSEFVSSQRVKISFFFSFHKWGKQALVFGKFHETEDFPIFAIHQSGKARVASAIRHQGTPRYLATVPKSAGSVDGMSDSPLLGFVSFSLFCQGA